MVGILAPILASLAALLVAKQGISPGSDTPAAVEEEIRADLADAWGLRAADYRVSDLATPDSARTDVELSLAAARFVSDLTGAPCSSKTSTDTTASCKRYWIERPSR